jgi:RNA polymerase sigma-70 factor (ECF subfamily)
VGSAVWAIPGGLSAAKAPRKVSLEARLRSLMVQGRAGDAAAQTELLRALSGYLRAYFSRRIGGAAAEVEDLVQDALIAIHFKRHTYDPGRPFLHWAYSVARYKLMDHFRRTGLRREAPIESAEALFATDDIEARSASQDLQKLLATLPVRQRTLLSDVKITGLSVQEAAAKAGMSPGAGKVSIHRAMKALSKKVGRVDG